MLLFLSLKLNDTRNQSCSKIEIWFMFNIQTKRIIVALFIYPEVPPCWFFLGPVIESYFICLFTRLRNPAQFPHNRHFYRTICLSKLAKFSFFFSHTVRRPALTCAALSL